MSGTLAGLAVRAIVVQQVDRDWWHCVTKGRFTPAGSPESRLGGARIFAACLREALELSIRTGLPVLVQPLNRAPRGLIGDELRERQELVADRAGVSRKPPMIAPTTNREPTA